MKVGTERTQQILDSLQELSLPEFQEKGEGFQEILLHMLSLISETPSNILEDWNEEEQPYSRGGLDLKLIEPHLVSSMPKYGSAGTKDVENRSFSRGSLSLKEVYPNPERSMESQGKISEIQMDRLLKAEEMNSREEEVVLGPMKKLMKGIEHTQTIRGTEKGSTPMVNDKAKMELLRTPSGEEQHPMIMKEGEHQREGMSAEENQERKELTNIVDHGDAQRLNGQSKPLVQEEIRDPKEVQNLKEVANRMVKEIRELRDGDSSVLKVKLKPEGLGEMEIRLEMKAGELIGKILVDTVAAKDALDQQMEHLRMQLRHQNIVLQEVDIDLQSQHQGSPNESGYPSPQQDRESLNFISSLRDHTEEGEELEAFPKDMIQIQAYYSKGHSSTLNLLA